MKARSLLIAGFGDIGAGLVDQLNDSVDIYGLRRQVQRLPATVRPVAADVTDASSLAAIKPVDSVVVTLTPGGFSDDNYRRVYVEGLRHLIAQIQQWPSAPLVVFVSSTSVYGQGAGEAVDENSPAEPTGFSGRRLREAEIQLAASGLPYIIVRFGGIYGPGRYRLIEQVRAGEGCPKKPPLYTNRIHRDDCVGFIAHLLQQYWAGELIESLYLAVDNESATLFEVKQWLASQLGCTLSVLVEAPRRNSKRCINTRLRASGYTLKYPTFRDGYAAVLNEWRRSASTTQ